MRTISSGPPRQGAETLRAECSDGTAALVRYRSHCETAIFAPAQSPHWIDCWARHCNRDVVVVRLLAGEDCLLALPLEIVREGSITTARFPGGTHANGNFPALSRDAAGRVGPDGARLLIEAVARTRPDVDLVRLDRLVETLDGTVNPLCGLPGFESPNPALAADLEGGFDALLSRASAKRKRKKHRSQTRKFEAAGGIRRFRAATRADTDRILDDFFAMKAVRFAAMGIHDVFADPEVQGFFRELFGGALADPRPAFVLDGLEVGGKLRAVTGCSLTETSVICEFGGIAEDELAYTSPGEYLFYESIRDACDQGYAIYDFSVGDEPYKRLWCDLETRHVDVLVPLSAKGRAARLLLRTTALAKRFVKSNRFLWEGVKRLRRQGQPAPPED